MRRNAETDPLTQEIRGLKNQVADLEIKIERLTKQHDDLTEITDLERQIAQLQLKLANLEEESARKIRETEHKTGLLREKQKQDLEHERRLAQLEIREGNLSKDEERLKAEMKFQREHMQREVDRFDGIVKSLMERLPNIEASLNVERSDTPAAARRGSRKSADED